ncbi:MAG: hypothetical protein J4F43_00550 [Dehalococcoidia bacterium]|nr:hypothetical protein [Dehalococcoidia bacterium]
MPILIRAVAVYLVLLAVAVAVNFIATPLYHPGGDEPFRVWEVLNYFMAVGIVLTVAAGYVEKRSVSGEGTEYLRRYIRANTVFYASVAVLLLFFWNWFSNLSADNVADGQVWTVVDTLMPIVVGITGCRVWRCAGR